MTTVRHYIDPEAAEEVLAAWVEYQKAQQQVSVAQLQFERASKIAAVGLGIKRGTQRKLDQDETGLFFLVELSEDDEAAIEGAEEKREVKRAKRREAAPAE